MKDNYPPDGNPYDTLDALIALAAEERADQHDARAFLRARLLTQVDRVAAAIARANAQVEEGDPDQLAAEKADERRLGGR